MQQKPTCDEIYSKLVNNEDDSYLTFEMAACFMAGYDSDKLRLLLKSRDEDLVYDGILVLQEMGHHCKNFAEEIRALAAVKNDHISRIARGLIEAYDI